MVLKTIVTQVVRQFQVESNKPELLREQVNALSSGLHPLK